MGVWGLSLFCDENANTCSELINLSELAGLAASCGKPPCTLLIDGLALLHHVQSRIATPWEWVLGGNNPEFEAELVAQIRQLNNAGLSLSVVFDSSYGTRGNNQDHEQEIRFGKRCEGIRRIMQQFPLDQHQATDSIKTQQGDSQLPQLATRQAVVTLKRLGVSVVTSEGEADTELALLLRSTPGAFAIVGTDSDFFVMEGVKFIPLRHLTVCENQVVARVFTRESVARALQLPPCKLCDLAALCGNDIFLKFMDKHNIAKALNIETVCSQRGMRCTPSKAATFLRTTAEEEPLVHHPVIAILVRKHADVAAALEANTAFYSTPNLDSGQGPASERHSTALSRLLAAGLRDCTLPPWVLAVNLHGVHFNGPRVEDMTECHSRIDRLLQPLRQVMYSLVAGFGCTVLEYERMDMARTPHKCPQVTGGTGAALLSEGLIKIRRKRRALREQALYSLLHSPTTFPRDTRAFRRKDMDLDPIWNLSQSWDAPVSANEDGGSDSHADQGGKLKLWGVGLLLRTLVLACQSARDTDGTGGSLPSPALDAFTFECLLTGALILGSGMSLKVPLFDPCVPTLDAVTMSSLFLAVCSSDVYLAQLLDLDDVFPEPARLFSGRLFAHLHRQTPAAQALVSRLPVPKWAVDELRSAVLAIFDQPLRGSTDRWDSTEDEVSESRPTTATSESQAPSASASKLVKQEPKPETQEMLVDRSRDQSLPVMEHKDTIIARVAQDQVVFFSGETGCGKSTMIPQFLVEDAVANGCRINIVVCQPRRVAAISLARRIASQRGEALGASVGYRIGHGDRNVSSKTIITIVTEGWLLACLAHNPDKLSKYTHVLLDEVHERTMDTDLLCLLLQRLGVARSKSRTKLVCMSATLEPGGLTKYFSQGGDCIKPVHVGSRRFAVDEIFLDDILQAFPRVGRIMQKRIERMARVFHVNPNPETAITPQDGEEQNSRSQKLSARMAKPELTQDGTDLVVEIILDRAEPGICILCLLPGEREIAGLLDQLEAAVSRKSTELQIFVVHSLVNKEDQDAALNPVDPACCKVVLATNILESSVTLPDVKLVIDTGLHRCTSYDDRRQTQCLKLEWCSQASAVQRAGRTGRTGPGTVVRLFTRYFLQSCMTAFSVPEIARSPLEKTVLTCKCLLAGLDSPSRLLAGLPTPPPPQRVCSAMKRLCEQGAIVDDDDLENAAVTGLGKFAASMPVTVPLVKLIALGITFGCLSDAIVMAGVLSVQPDLFSMPSRALIRNTAQFTSMLMSNFQSRVEMDAGSYSEPIALLNAYKSWLRNGRNPEFARKMCLHNTRMWEADYIISSITEHTKQLIECTTEDSTLLGQLEKLQRAAQGKSSPREVRGLFSINSHVLRFVLVAAFAPNFLVGQSSSWTKGKGSELVASALAASSCSEDCLVNVSGLTKTYTAEEWAASLAGFGFNMQRKSLVQVSGNKAAFTLGLRRCDETVTRASKVGVRDICCEAKVLIQLTRSSFDSKSISVPIPTPQQVASGETELVFSNVTAPNPVKWKQLGKKEGVSLNWRAPIGVMADLNNTAELLAVAHSFLTVGKSVTASGVTLLPTNMFSKVVPLVFARKPDTVKVWCNQELTYCYRVSVGDRMVRFPFALTMRQMGGINLMRSIISKSFIDLGAPYESGQEGQDIAEFLKILNMDLEHSGDPGLSVTSEQIKEGTTLTCCFEQSSDFLPQVRVAHEIAFKCDTVWLLCGCDTSPVQHLPPASGFWVKSREECATGTSAWHEILFRECMRELQKFTEIVQLLLTGLTSVVVSDSNAVLDFGPLSKDQSQVLRQAICQVGLVRTKEGPGPRHFVAISNQAQERMQPRRAVAAQMNHDSSLELLEDSDTAGNIQNTGFETAEAEAEARPGKGKRKTSSRTGPSMERGPARTGKGGQQDGQDGIVAANLVEKGVDNAVEKDTVVVSLKLHNIDGMCQKARVVAVVDTTSLLKIANKTFKLPIGSGLPEVKHLFDGRTGHKLTQGSLLVKGQVIVICTGHEQVTVTLKLQHMGRLCKTARVPAVVDIPSLLKVANDKFKLTTKQQKAKALFDESNERQIAPETLLVDGLVLVVSQASSNKELAKA